MNKFCYVNYVSSDSNDTKAAELNGFRLVTCRFKGRVGFFAKRKIKKLTNGFCTLDEMSAADDLFEVHPKELFKENTVLAVKEFSRIYNIDMSESQIVIAFDLPRKSLAELSDCMKMIYVIAPKKPCDLYNVFYTDYLPGFRFDFAMIDDAGFGIPAEYIFNLSDDYIPGAVNDIRITAGDFDIIPDNARNSAVFYCRAPFSVCGFVR